MTRLLAVLVASLAALLMAPAAFGASFVVDSNGDEPDADTTVPVCATAGSTCTLRAAIEQANATAGADAISFAAGGQAPAPLAALPAVTGQLSIDGGGTVAVTFDAAATGTLLDLEAPSSVVHSINFTGGDAAATLLKLGSSGDHLAAVKAHDLPGAAVRITGTGGRVDGSTIKNTAGAGVRVDGATATIATTTVTGSAGPGLDLRGNGASVNGAEISAAGGDGITISGSNATVAGGHVHGNGGNGVAISGQNDVVSGVIFYANGGKPIADAPGANGGVAPPAGLRIGPRRADGSLPLNGNAHAGQLEVWAGNPATTVAPGFVAGFHVSGDFGYNFPSEPSPGSVFSVSLSGDGLGSSEFETVTVPQDVSSPNASFARALDTTAVRVDFTEPLDPGSVQPADFHLNMAGVDRAISAATVAPDGRSVTLAASGWRAGEAGVLDMPAPGSVTDAVGNAMTTAPHLRVAAAPGDFLAPLGGSLSVTPKTICLTRARTCKKPGMTIKFTTTEAGKATMMIKRSNVTIGKRLYGNIVAGKNTLKFNGRLGARKLRAGRYRMLIYVQDPVGNVTDQPPIVLFTVRRTTK